MRHKVFELTLIAMPSGQQSLSYDQLSIFERTKYCISLLTTTASNLSNEHTALLAVQLALHELPSILDLTTQVVQHSFSIALVFKKSPLIFFFTLDKELSLTKTHISNELALVIRVAHKRIEFAIPASLALCKSPPVHLRSFVHVNSAPLWKPLDELSNVHVTVAELQHTVTEEYPFSELSCVLITVWAFHATVACTSTVLELANIDNVALFVSSKATNAVSFAS